MSLLDKIRKNNKKTAKTDSKNQTNVKVEKKQKNSPEKKLEKKDVKKDFKNTGKAYRVLIKPVISEKAAIKESMNVYTFVVDRQATKIDIKDAVEAVYGIRPVKVRTMNYEGKRVRFGYIFGRRKDWKKAVVYLPAGKSINIHSGV